MVTEGPTAVLEPLWRELPALGSEKLSGSAAYALPPRHEAVRSARDFTHRTLRRWQIARDLDEIALVVSELVTNALRHGLDAQPGATAAPRRPACAETARLERQPVRLQLMRWSARLVCAVRDPSEAAPRKAEGPASGCTAEGTGLLPALGLDLDGLDGLDELDEGNDLGLPGGSGEPESPGECPGLAAESGRGLFLVDSFSDAWGWHRLTGTRPGKVVWAMFQYAPRH
jgi:hypothetical protein